MSIRMLTLTAALLAGGGCVSYSYHSGYGGDYYSGTPSVEYRYVSPGGYYSYSPYWYGGYGYYGVPYYYGHRYRGGYGYGGGYPWWGSPYYYGGGAWGYNHGPYKPPPVTPPVVTPPRTVRYLDTPHDARRYPGHRGNAGRPYSVAPPPGRADGSPHWSRPITPPSTRPVSPPPSRPVSPPPSTPRVAPARPLPPTPARVVTPSSSGSEAKATPYSPKGATRSRSRYLDSDDP